MIPELSILGSVVSPEEERILAERKILSHDPEAHDIVEVLLG